jgi:hypothetical protein
VTRVIYLENAPFVTGEILHVDAASAPAAERYAELR